MEAAHRSRVELRRARPSRTPRTAPRNRAPRPRRTRRCRCFESWFFAVYEPAHGSRTLRQGVRGWHAKRNAQSIPGVDGRDHVAQVGDLLEAEMSRDL